MISRGSSKIETLIRLLEKDRLIFREGRIYRDTEIQTNPIAPLLPDLMRIGFEFNSVRMMQHIRRMEESIESDPSLAIGSAKELLETCCKTILDERGVSFRTSADVPSLVKETLKVLHLLPDDALERDQGLETLKRLAGNLASLGHCLAEIRNRYGTGHGRHVHSRTLEARHAKLVVGAAAALANFLFETHKQFPASN